jgi:hypothetical protein
MVENMHGVNPALVGGMGANGKPQIVTGTYSPGANNVVSDLELLKAQLQTGEFAKAFVVGLVRMGTVKMEDLMSQLGGAIGGAIGGVVGGAVGAVSGAVSGAGSGAMSGASEGWQSGASQGYQSGYAAGGGGGVGEAMGEAEGALEGAVGAVTGFFGGAIGGAASGGAQGAQEGAAEGSSMGTEAGAGTAGKAVDAAGNWVLSDAQFDMLIAGALIQAQLGPAIGIVDQILSICADKKTEQSGSEAADRKLPGPTHSQIAKDAPDHPLFEISNLLAQEADKQIGKAMEGTWAALASGSVGGAGGPGPTPAGAGGTGAGSGGTAPATSGAPSTDPNSPGSPVAGTGGGSGAVTDEQATPVTSLVDKLVSQPSSDDWWKSVLVPALGP